MDRNFKIALLLINAFVMGALYMGLGFGCGMSGGLGCKIILPLLIFAIIISFLSIIFSFFKNLKITKISNILFVLTMMCTLILIIFISISSLFNLNI